MKALGGWNYLLHFCLFESRICICFLYLFKSPIFSLLCGFERMVFGGGVTSSSIFLFDLRTLSWRAVWLPCSSLSRTSSSYLHVCRLLTRNWVCFFKLMCGCIVCRMWIVLSLRWEVSMRFPIMLALVAKALTFSAPGPAGVCPFPGIDFFASSRVRLLLMCFCFFTHAGLRLSVSATPVW